MWRDVPPLMASSPPIITQKPWSRRGTVGKNSQQGELIIDDSKNHTRPAERTNGSTSNHLTPKAPYKPDPGMNREIGAKIERVVDLAPGPVPIGAIGTPHMRLFINRIAGIPHGSGSMPLSLSSNPAPYSRESANLSRRFSAHVAAIAAYREPRARADRERLVCRTPADRLRRRNADPRLPAGPEPIVGAIGS